jgi:hypothetical protein
MNKRHFFIVKGTKTGTEFYKAFKENLEKEARKRAEK